jgi:hypothetical protein
MIERDFPAGLKGGYKLAPTIRTEELFNRFAVFFTLKKDTITKE